MLVKERVWKARRVLESIIMLPTLIVISRRVRLALRPMQATAHMKNYAATVPFPSFLITMNVLLTSDTHLFC